MPSPRLITLLIPPHICHRLAHRMRTRELNIHFIPGDIEQLRFGDICDSESIVKRGPIVKTERRFVGGSEEADEGGESVAEGRRGTREDCYSLVWGWG